MVYVHSCSSGETRVSQTLSNNVLKIELLKVYKKKFLYKNEPQKAQNLKKMLRKSPASNARATIFRNAEFL